MIDSFIYLQHFDRCCSLIHTIDDKPVAAFIDHHESPRLGDIYRGRVVKLETAYAFVDIGISKPALLKRRALTLHEGQYVNVRIVREGIKNSYEKKGPQVVLDDTQNDKLSLYSHDNTVACLLRRAPKWQQYIQDLVAKISKDKDIAKQSILIIVNTEDLFIAVKQICQNEKIIIKLQQQSFPDHVKTCWNDLLHEVHTFDEGGYIVMEETAVLTTIDINTTAFCDSDRPYIILNEQERLRFNIRVASNIAYLIDLRAIHGTIMIDFLRHNNKKFDTDLIISLKKLLSTRRHLKVLGYTSTGLVELHQPTRGPSLKDQAFLRS